jgi:hypothetical protein
MATFEDENNFGTLLFYHWGGTPCGRFFMQRPGLYGVALALLLSSAAPLAADPVEVNSRSVSIISGDMAWFPRLVALAQTLDNQRGLRVIPMASSGCMQSAADVLRLEQVDVALLTTDCVAYAEQQGLLPQASHELAYLTRLEALPIVLVARKNIATLTALAGLRIATGPADSAAFATGELVLGGLGLPFRRVPKSGVEGLAALKAGRADAVLLLGLDALDASMTPEAFHLLSLSAPTTLGSVYSPALVPSDKLFGLSQGQDFETISAALTFVALQKPRTPRQQKRVALFSSLYFQDQQADGRSAQLSTSIAGWRRHDASTSALRALDNIPEPQTETLQQGDGP